MLVCGYIGEAFSDGTTGHSVQWGVLSTLGYIYILHAVWLGEVAQLADASKSDVVKRGVRTLAWFVLVGWAIYPIGYMIGTGDGMWYEFMTSMVSAENIDFVYNVGDSINKIGFGLVVYNLAVSK